MSASSAGRSGDAGEEMLTLSAGTEAQVPIDRADEGVGMAHAAGPSVAAAAAAPSPAGRERADQMEAIRKALQDVGTGPDTGPRAGWEHPALTAAQARARMSHERGETRDELKYRLDSLTKGARAEDGEAQPSNYDIARLRRSHEKRVKQLLRSKARRRRGPAFLAGFTLVAMVTAALVGIYVFHPQIIAAAPKWAPAVEQYVVTVDHYRQVGDERTAPWRKWLAERIDNLAGKAGWSASGPTG